MTMMVYLRKVFFIASYFCYIINGSKGAGKSTLVEYILEVYLKMGFLVFDFWAAGNFENCFWTVPGMMDPKRNGSKGKKRDITAKSLGYPVLIIRPETTIIQQDNPKCTCGLGQ